MATAPLRLELGGFPSTPTSANEAIHNTRSKPGPATGGLFYAEDERRPSMTFLLCPATARLWQPEKHAWIAHMDVKCDDVPLLMREGFHWDASNVIKEEGYFDDSEIRDGKVLPKRCYFLADIHQPRRWIAFLRVYAYDANILHNFDLSLLSPELIRCASADNQYGQRIYKYQAYTAPDKSSRISEIPMIRFNTIYDKMPMEGFWPWPRKRSENDLADHTEKYKGYKTDYPQDYPEGWLYE
ncbi:hypothetical protein F5Y14DRAFT_127740 [Nemania sp. NC0429]|nr:hypothetical protein F5Y14DRAFT_127740 [Nemania sp. NC0429]